MYVKPSNQPCLAILIATRLRIYIRIMPFFNRRPQDNFSCLRYGFTLIAAMALTAPVTAEQMTSKRIEVYTLSQSYWDTQYGDTLGSIVYHLLPNNPSKRDALMWDILNLNPDAFIDNDPARLLAGKRLQLPGYMKQADTKADPDTTIVERYSWGNIKRPRE